MKVTIRLTAYVTEDDLPSSFSNPEYLEETLRENLQDVFSGAAIKDIDIEMLIVDRED